MVGFFIITLPVSMGLASHWPVQRTNWRNLRERISKKVMSNRLDSSQRRPAQNKPGAYAFNQSSLVAGGRGMVN